MSYSSLILVRLSLPVLLGAVILIGCSNREITDGTVVTVLYTSDVRGKVEGCGCKHNGGGVTKRAAKMKAIRGDDASAVYCDAGNWLTGTPEVDASKGLLSVSAYNELAATVVNVSERELALGLDAFRAARKDSKFSYVSANLRVDGSAVADPYVVKRVKEARVAYIGLCGMPGVMRFDSLKLPAETTIEDPVVAARRYVAELADKADLIIILSTCGDAVDSSLASALPQVALIVGGRSYRPNSDAPWVIGTTRVVRADRDGRTMGRMDMVFGPDRKIKMYNPSTITMEITDPGDEAMLNVIRKFIPSFVDNPTDGVRIPGSGAAVASTQKP